MEAIFLKYSFFLRVLNGWVTGVCLLLPQPGKTRLYNMSVCPLLSIFCLGWAQGWASGLRLRQTVSLKADTHIIIAY